jgi:predicted Zn-dependent peptidase
MHHKIILDNGVRILYEHVDSVRSVSVGIWVLNGSRNEPKKLNGISHFIEHMLFKGTESRSASEIAELMDSIGGQVNAFTTKECTCFYARVLDSHFSDAADILTDMLFNPKLDESDLNIERGVILEEIGMYNDTPEELVSERLMSAVYSPTPLAMPILGTSSTLKSINSAVMREYMQKNYVPENIVVSISGSFTDKDIRLIEDIFSGMSGNKPAPPEKGIYTASSTVKKKSTDQNHIILAFEGPRYGSPDRYANVIMTNILGGGMSSRLFRKVREENGLCYSVYSYIYSHKDTGLFGIYTATGKETERQAIELIVEVIMDLLENGITQQELDRAREQSKANVLLALESTVSRMNTLARGELFLGEILRPEEIIERYDAVTRTDVLESARKIICMDKLSLSAVGKVESAQAYMDLIHNKLKA